MHLGHVYAAGEGHRAHEEGRPRQGGADGEARHGLRRLEIYLRNIFFFGGGGRALRLEQASGPSAAARED